MSLLTQKVFDVVESALREGGENDLADMFVLALEEGVSGTRRVMKLTKLTESRKGR